MLSLKEDIAEVERLTHILVRILNSRDFSYANSDGKELLVHIAPDFEARFDAEDHSLSFDQQTGLWQKNAEDWPHLQFSVLELTTNVQRRSGTARVFLKLALTGMSDIQYQGACELEWRWSGEKWLLRRHITMRGLLPLL